MIMKILPINKKSFCHLNIWHLIMVMMLKWKTLFSSNKKFLMMTSVFSPNLNCFSPFLGAKYLSFFSSRSLKMREKCISFAQWVLLSLYILWAKCVYLSIFYNKIHNYKKIYKLRKTNTFFSHFEGTRGGKNITFRI